MPTLKSTGKRSFTINNAYHVDGCKTKFSHKDYTGRFVGKSAQRAASKALTELCHAKRIRGQCTLYIEMRETTQGSKHKVYAYQAKRVKYSEPVVYGDVKREYHNVIKHVRIPTEKCVKSHKSSGRMFSFRKSHASKSKSKMSKKHHSKTKKSSK
jgi:hypothetical protein